MPVPVPIPVPIPDSGFRFPDFPDAPPKAGFAAVEQFTLDIGHLEKSFPESIM